MSQENEIETVETVIDEKPWQSALPGDAWALTLFGVEFAAVAINGGGFVLRDVAAMGTTLSLMSPGIASGRLLFRQEMH